VRLDPPRDDAFGQAPRVGLQGLERAGLERLDVVVVHGGRLGENLVPRHDREQLRGGDAARPLLARLGACIGEVGVALAEVRYGRVQVWVIGSAGCRVGRRDDFHHAGNLLGFTEGCSLHTRPAIGCYPGGTRENTLATRSASKYVPCADGGKRSTGRHGRPMRDGKNPRLGAWNHASTSPRPPPTPTARRSRSSATSRNAASSTRCST